MSSQSSDQQLGQGPPAAAAGPGSKTLATTDSQLLTERGTTSIADGVVQKIAGIATREVPGIHNMGTGRVRTFGAVRELIPGTGGPNISQGVAVDVGRTQPPSIWTSSPSTACRSTSWPSPSAAT